MVMPGAESYYWEGNNQRAVLLVHGFTGTPAELRELGETLHQHGYTVYGLRLAGHGTDPRELTKVTYPEWLDQVREAVENLKHQCREVTVIGLSMGGLLAVYAGTLPQVDRLVLISTPIYLYDWRIHFLWLADRQKAWALPKHPREIDAPERYNVAYSCMPLFGIHQLEWLLLLCKGRWLRKVQVPLLIIQSRTDHTVRPESARYLYAHVSSRKKKLLWVPKARHVMTLYKGREKIYQSILHFLEDKKYESRRS